MPDWYYKSKTDIKGPFNDDQLHALCEAGVINKDTQIRRSSDSIWDTVAKTIDFPFLHLVDENELDSQLDAFTKTTDHSSNVGSITPMKSEQKSLVGLQQTCTFLGIGGILSLLWEMQQLMIQTDDLIVVRTLSGTTETTSTPELFSVFFIISFAVVFLVWMYRATSNLYIRNLKGLRIKPIGTIIWWFIPIAFLWKPFQALSQIERGGRYGNDWSEHKSSTQLKWYWFLWLLSLAFSIGLALFVENIGESNSYYRGVITFLKNLYLVTTCLSLIATGILIKLIIDISEISNVNTVGGEFKNSNSFENKANTLKSRFSLVQLASGVAVIIAALLLVSETRKQGNWVFIDESSSSKTRRYLTLLESGSTNTYSKTTLRVTCMSDSMDVEVMWGAPMKNMYPDKSVPTATRVSAQFGDTAAWDMGWQPSSDGFITRAPGVQLDVASGIDSFLFSILGMDSISKNNKEMFNWTAEQFVNRIAKQAHSSSENHFLRLSAKNTSNSKLTLKFDLSGFNELANQHFKGVCIN